MKSVYKRSTKILLLAVSALGGVASWAMDPQNLAALQTLAHGHARVLTLLGGIAAAYGVLHEPKTEKKVKK